MAISMYILKTIVFVSLCLGGFIWVMHYGLGHSPTDIAGILAIGAVFIGLSILGYIKMYSDDD